jgi:tetratricopeptide (TPR) repeat protein
MTPELWQRLKPLFHEALSRDAEQRPAFIQEACGDDVELRMDLLQLVQAAEEGTLTLDAPLVRVDELPAARFNPGEVLLGRFRIVRPVGSGGMGEVYEAEDLQLGRVALKTILQSIAGSPEAFDRFRHEVMLARKISGAQVCRIHELYLLPAAGRIASTAFLTMEYLEGITLSQKLKADGPLPPRQAQKVALDICEGLRLVHANGVIHRDLKSANIMLCGQGESLRAVLMDFGLAHDLGSVPSAGDGASSLQNGSAATLPGTILGTPAYMAPEQFEGSAVSPATDIYALGIVLYEMVTGLHPYAAPTPVAAAIRRAHQPAAPSSLVHAVSRKWDRIIQRCLQYEPKDRFQSAPAVAKALRAGPANFNSLRRDRPWAFRLVSLLLLAACAWGVFAWWQIRQYYHPSPEALRKYGDGLSLIRQGNYAEATRILQAALSQDKHYVMAHARLAEAWYDLDFQGSAQQELLIALPERNRLSPLDRMYLDAIRSTVAGDSAAALATYQQILGEISDADRAPAYVDLGMAYERAGNIKLALDSYARAAAQDSNNPAAYMHTAVLESRLHHVKEGEKAFASAQAIFAGELDSYGRPGNPEGLAELDYERGYAANDRGDSADAEPLLARSLEEAEKIPSVQLEIRALCQLSSAESVDYKDAQAVAHAQKAIDLARDHQLGSWAAVGLVRLANVQLVQGHLKEAEQPLQEAMEILRESPQPRVQALANTTVASLMDLEHHPDKVEAPAQAALNYYKQNGFSEGASNDGLLLVRAERDKGLLQQALVDGNALLALDEQHGLPTFIAKAEEAVGMVYLAMEQYPTALEHFQNAQAKATSEEMRAYQALHSGEADWKLGRYADSDAMLRLAAASPSTSRYAAESHVESLLSQEKYRVAIEEAQQAIKANPTMALDWKEAFELDEAVAQAHVGMRSVALAGLNTVLSSDHSTATPTAIAHLELAASEIYLSLGMRPEASKAATTASVIFERSGELDSELRSVYLVSSSSPSDCAEFSKKSVDFSSVRLKVK